MLPEVGPIDPDPRRVVVCSGVSSVEVDRDVTPSVVERSLSPQATGHTMHWFTECGRPGADGGWEMFCLQGVIRFGDLRVERADSRPVSTPDFVDDARRWWVAFRGRDPRLSSAAQQQAQAGAASWRAWGGTSAMVPGTA